MSEKTAIRDQIGELIDELESLEPGKGDMGSVEVYILARNT